MSDKHILVLGVGNTLLKDEGVGVRVIETLEANYGFSPNVELYDGGTLGLRLLDPITNSDYVIVVDAVQNRGEPGTLYRLPMDEIEKRVAFKNSLHQLSLVEAMVYADLMGSRPESIIIGIEPGDITPWGGEFTEPVRNNFEELCRMVLAEIRTVGGDWWPLGEGAAGNTAQTG